MLFPFYRMSMMTKLKRMVVVDVWLRSGQTLMDYVDNLGLDVGTFLGWIMDYGQPADLSTWIEPPRVSWRPGGVSQTVRVCSVS